MENKKNNKKKKTKEAPPPPPPPPPVDERTWNFDPDAFLASLTQETCPIHDEMTMEKRTSQNGWEYCVCPKQDCFIFTGTQELPFYLEQVRRQLHQYYKTAPMMHCPCYNPVTLSMSRSVKNPNRLYFRCGRRECNFFQWADQVPSTLRN